MEFILIGVIVLFIFQSHRLIDSKKFIDDNQEYFRGMMEDDYEFFLKSKYGDDVDVNAEYSKRIRNGIVTIVVFIFLFLNNMNFINIFF